MLFIIDKRIPEEAKQRLKDFGDMLELHINDTTYDAIAGHPDIFFCKTPGKLITASNLPEDYRKFLIEKNIHFIPGERNVEVKYPLSAVYNAVVTDEYLIHKLNITDPVILKHSEHLKRINIEQGYSRCSLIPLKQNNFITSDEGIYKTLSGLELNVLYVSSEDVLLPGFKHGFLGGTCGVYENRIYFIGSLEYLTEGSLVREYLTNLGYEIIELYEGPLFDGGSILVI